MMRQHDRRHRLLAALAAGPARYRDLKAAARNRRHSKPVDRARTWATLQALADDGLVALGAGWAALTPIGEIVLAHAERAWSAGAEQEAA